MKKSHLQARFSCRLDSEVVIEHNKNKINEANRCLAEKWDHIMPLLVYLHCLIPVGRLEAEEFFLSWPSPLAVPPIKEVLPDYCSPLHINISPGLMNLQCNKTMELWNFFYLSTKTKISQRSCFENIIRCRKLFA